MQSNDCALIIFSNPSSASQAELIFNQQQFINENNVNLSLTFCNEIESQYAWERSKQDKLLMTAKQNYKESSPMVSSTLNTSFSPSVTFAHDFFLNTNLADFCAEIYLQIWDSNWERARFSSRKEDYWIEGLQHEENNSIVPKEFK